MVMKSEQGDCKPYVEPLSVMVFGRGIHVCPKYYKLILGQPIYIEHTRIVCLSCCCEEVIVPPVIYV